MSVDESVAFELLIRFIRRKYKRSGSEFIRLCESNGHVIVMI